MPTVHDVAAILGVPEEAALPLIIRWQNKLNKLRHDPGSKAPTSMMTLPLRLRLLCYLAGFKDEDLGYSIMKRHRIIDEVLQRAERACHEIRTPEQKDERLISEHEKFLRSFE